MNKKYLLLATLVSPLAAVAPLSAAPLVSIGDNVDVFFNGSSSVRWMSNVFRDEDDEVEDLLLTVSPGFEVNVGRGLGNADLSIITRYDFLRYDDQSQLNTELFHIKAVGSYRSSRLDLSGSAAFDEEQSTTGNEQVTNNRQALIESENVRANLDAEYRWSPKFSFGAGVRYHDREYTTYRDLLADRETISFPFDVFYELTPKIDLSAGYTYSHTDVDSVEIIPGFSERGSYDTESHFFNVGARGSLLPKLTGFFKVGYRIRETDDATNLVLGNPTPRKGSDTGMLGLNADFTWTYSPKLSTRLALSRDFGVGGEGSTTENTSADLSARYSINAYWAASANFGYTLREYDNANNREDDQYVAGLRLSYTPNEYWRFSTGYTYAENKSTEDDLSYKNHILDLSATLRY